MLLAERVHNLITMRNFTCYLIRGGFLSVTCFSINSSCGKYPIRAKSVPENLISDVPIIIKEGQAILLKKDGDKKLTIGVSVVNGILTISDVGSANPSFGISYTNSRKWETTIDHTVNGEKIHMFDNDMDGVFDYKILRKNSITYRFKSKPQEWEELQESIDK